MMPLALFVDVCSVFFDNKYPFLTQHPQQAAIMVNARGPASLRSCLAQLAGPRTPMPGTMGLEVLVLDSMGLEPEGLEFMDLGEGAPWGGGWNPNMDPAWSLKVWGGWIWTP